MRIRFQVGRIVGAIIFGEFNNGFLDRQQLHIVGHSLGAQMAGLIGRSLQKLSGNTEGMKLAR